MNRDTLVEQLREWAAALDGLPESIRGGPRYPHSTLVGVSAGLRQVAVDLEREHGYTLAEVRDGTGWPKGVRFFLQLP